MATIVSQAKAMYAAFEKKTRTNGDSFYALKDDSPQWMTDVIYDVHDGLLPDDETYEMIRDTVSAIEELDNDADADEINEAIDEMEPEYRNHQLALWLANGNYEYCDQAIEEFGPFESTFNLLQAGQLMHIREIGYSVVSALRDSLENEDEDETEDA